MKYVIFHPTVICQSCGGEFCRGDSSLNQKAVVSPEPECPHSPKKQRQGFLGPESKSLQFPVNPLMLSHVSILVFYQGILFYQGIYYTKPSFVPTFIAKRWGGNILMSFHLGYTMSEHSPSGSPFLHGLIQWSVNNKLILKMIWQLTSTGDSTEGTSS